MQNQIGKQQIQASEELKAVEKQLSALRNEHISSIARLQVMENLHLVALPKDQINTIQCIVQSIVL